MAQRDREKEKDGSAGDTARPFGEPVTIRLADALDLHAFQPKDIPSVVEEYLKQCQQAGYREVRLIHGKGKGVQRNIVRSLSQQHHDVDSFHDAPLEVGSWGATIVALKQES